MYYRLVNVVQLPVRTIAGGVLSGNWRMIFLLPHHYRCCLLPHANIYIQFIL